MFCVNTDLSLHTINAFGKYVQESTKGPSTQCKGNTQLWFHFFVTKSLKPSLERPQVMVDLQLIFTCFHLHLCLTHCHCSGRECNCNLSHHIWKEWYSCLKMHLCALFVLHCTKATEQFCAPYKRQNLSALFPWGTSKQIGKQDSWPKHLDSTPAFNS